MGCTLLAKAPDEEPGAHLPKGAECRGKLDHSMPVNFEYATITPATKDTECPDPTGGNVGDAINHAIDEFDKAAGKYCEKGTPCEPPASCKPTVTDLSTKQTGTKKKFNAQTNTLKCFVTIEVKGKITCTCK
ncbi:MAG: hypothetical protein O7H41_20300 [Planctomycetota bacterium]|nr:hypothetical protein [Planctomycetota bacterium]